jgi:hypothetical protein
MTIIHQPTVIGNCPQKGEIHIVVGVTENWFLMVQNAQYVVGETVKDD